MVMKLILVLICTFILCAVLACAQSIAGQFIFQSYDKPLPIPKFSLENLQGKIVHTWDYRGKILLLNFQATW